MSFTERIEYLLHVYDEQRMRQTYLDDFDFS